MRWILALALMPVFGSALSHAQVANGNFETPTITSGQWITYEVGGPSVGGWEVTEGTVDVVTSAFLHAGTLNSGQSVDLNGSGPGTIAQQLALGLGQFYKVSFTYDLNQTSARVLQFGVFWNDELKFLHSVRIPTSNAQLNPGSIGTGSFYVSSSGSDWLKFKSYNNDTAGFLLDNVAISLDASVSEESPTLTYFAAPELSDPESPVPEPREYGLISGLALCAFALRRRIMSSRGCGEARSSHEITG